MEKKRIFVLDERSPQISSSLALEIGLNESLILLHIEQCQSNEGLESMFYFWDREMIAEILGNLQKKGYIVKQDQYYAINYEKVAGLKSIVIIDNKHIPQDDKKPPTNSEIIAELVDRYRGVAGVKPAKSDYAFIGRAYNENGYNKMILAIDKLKNDIGYIPKDPKAYLLGILKNDKPLNTDTRKDVEEIFKFYIKTFKNVIPGKITLTPEREKCIADRLTDGYSVDYIKKAIANIRTSEYHCGGNPGGFFLADISYICKNSTKLEEWANRVIKTKANNLVGISEMLQKYETKYSS